MKILVLNPYIYPLLMENKKNNLDFGKWRKYFGGAQVTLSSVILGLAKNRDFAFHLWVWKDFITPHKKCVDDEFTFHAGPYFNPNTLNLSQKLSLFFYLIKLFFLVRPKIILKTDFANSIEILISLYCKFFKAKYIYLSLTAHEIERDKESSHNKMIFKFLSFSTNHIICQTNTHKESIKSLVNCPNFYVINNIYNIIEDHLLELTFKNHVIWFGRNAINKYPEGFIEICQKLSSHIPKVMVCTFNNGPFVTYEELKTQVKNIENFHLINLDTYTSTQHYFKKALIHINTSHYEGLPNTFLQALYEGVPIGTLYYDTDQLISANNIGLCSNGDIPQLISFIEELAAKPPLREFYNIKARQFYEAEFSYSKNLQKLENIMDEVSAS